MTTVADVGKKKAESTEPPDERGGVGLAAAQKLMRHSTPVLTSKHYTRRSAGEMAAEVNKLGAVRRAEAVEVEPAPVRKPGGGRKVRFKKG